MRGRLDAEAAGQIRLKHPVWVPLLLQRPELRDGVRPDVVHEGREQEARLHVQDLRAEAEEAGHVGGKEERLGEAAADPVGVLVAPSLRILQDIAFKIITTPLQE